MREENQNEQLRPFHLAIPVSDLALAREFYREILGLSEGRSSETWVDFNFFGHQLVIHAHPKTPYQENALVIVHKKAYAK